MTSNMKPDLIPRLVPMTQHPPQDLRCEREGFIGIAVDGCVLLLCTTCSRINTGRSLKIHHYHCWRLTLDGPEPLGDLQVLKGTPSDQLMAEFRARMGTDPQ